MIDRTTGRDIVWPQWPIEEPDGTIYAAGSIRMRETVVRSLDVEFK